MTSQANEADFLAAIGSDSYRETLKDILSACTTLGMSIEWGSKGASFRVPTPDRNERLSIGWVLPPDTHWQGARHLSLGVGHASLAQTPTVRDAVLAFVERIQAIQGAEPVPGKLDGYIFEPAVVPAAKDAVAEALELLVEGVQQVTGSM